MLTTIREKAQGWIAWVIVIFISVPFALWGINEYFDAEKKVPVAEINGSNLMSHEYQRQLQNQRNTLRQRFGGKIDNKIFETPVFKKQVLNEMIAQRLISFDIQKQNYQIGDKQLASYLRSSPSFQVEGAFSSELYAQAVRSNGLSPTAFESQIRLGNIVEQIQQGFSGSVITSEAEIDALLSLQQEKRSYVSVSLAGKIFTDKVSVTEEEIKRYYDENKKSFMTTEEVRVEYIALSLSDLAKQVQPNEEALRTYFQENKDQYTQPEQRKAQHILLTVAKDASSAEVQRVEDQARDIASRATAGEDFSELAKKLSVDTISSEFGGDLGFFERGVMDAAFDEKVFSMQKGEISEPVKSRFGIHVIKLNEIKDKTGKTFDEVQDELREKYALREASLRFGQMAEEMQNIVYEQPTTLQPAADALGLQVVSSEWFSRAGGKGLATERPFIDSAFTEDVLLESLNSEVVELSADTLAALRSLEHRASEQMPLADVTDKIKTILLALKTKELVRIESEKLVQSLQAGETTLKKIADKFKIELSEKQDVSRTGQPKISTALLRKVFSTPPSSDGSDSEAASVKLENGDYAIFSVTKILKGNPKDAPEGVRTQIQSVLLKRHGEDMFLGYERGLQEQSDIVIHEEKL